MNVKDLSILIGWSRRWGFRPFTVCLALPVVLLVCFASDHPVSAQTPGEAEAEEPVRPQVVRVALAQFTTAIEDREPIDQITFVGNDVQKVFFYTDLRDLEGQTISHRWLHNGIVVANVTFEVRGPRWRVWSSKKMLPDLIGDWTVEIVTAEGEVIAAETFTYKAPDA
jgi:hypothetical protein